MTIARIFQDSELKVGSSLILDEPASHHLARVLRVKINDKIMVFNGQGGEYESMITAINKKNVIVLLEKYHATDVESPLELWLAQGIARGEKMDYIIQKSVELGVKKIIPLLTERSTVKLDQERRDRRKEHWRSIVISACEQCGRTEIPEVVAPLPLSAWLAEKPPMDLGFVLAPLASAKLPTDKSTVKRIILLIGPEGGLTLQEIKLASQQDFVSLNLGPRVLRTETAAVAALAIFQSIFGDI